MNLVKILSELFTFILRIKEAEEQMKKMTEEKKDVAKKTKEAGGLKSKLRDKLQSKQ